MQQITLNIGRVVQKKMSKSVLNPYHFKTVSIQNMEKVQECKYLRIIHFTLNCYLCAC